MEAPQKVIEINQTYVDEHLREFFDAKQTPVNIDNICLFSAKTIEEYNIRSEVKLAGQQKLEAACELAKNVIDKAMVFVPEDQRRKISKNIYHNIDSIESTIQFVVNISNDPNIINIGKWIRSDSIPDKVKKGFFSKLFCCGGGKKAEEKTEETKAEDKTGEKKTDEKPEETKSEVIVAEEIPEAKKESKQEKKDRLKKEEEEKKIQEAQAKKEKKEKEEQEAQAKKDDIKKKKEEKKERERKIKELLEETDRKVKELKEEKKPEAVVEPPSEEKEVEIEI